MAGRRPDALTDDALDRELTAALAVDPSPEFQARVRTRIAAEPAPRSPWLRWAVLTACAAPVVLALVLVDPAIWPDRTEPVPLPARASDVALAANPIARPPAVAPQVTPPPRRITGAAPRIAAAPPREPVVGAEVLIAPEERRAFQLFQRILREGALDADAFAGAEPAAQDVQALVVVPITIEPLNQVSE